MKADTKKRHTSKRVVREHDAMTSESEKRAKAHGGCLGSRRRRRTRQAAKVCGEARTAVDPQVSEWGNPPREGAASAIAEANPTNRNIPVVGGKENNSDPPSSGERKGASPNRPRQGADGVVGQPSWTKRR